MVEVKQKMDPKAKTIMILFLLLIVGIILGFVISQVGLGLVQSDFEDRYDLIKQTVERRIGDRPALEPYINNIMRNNWDNFSEKYTIVTIFICLNLMLLLGLLFNYVSSFRTTKSSFMLGLIMIFGVLFMQSLFSLPLIQSLFNQSIFDLGLIHIFPNLFETIALIIFFYISSE